MVRRGVLIAFVAAFLLLTSAGASFAAESVFIHLTANFKEDDGPVCVAFNASRQALRSGDKVEIFFDQEATWGIKQWEPGKTDLGLYPLPERINDLLLETFGGDRAALPANYQEYLQQLQEEGARITTNGFWNALTEVEKSVKGRENILSFVEPITLAEMLQHRRATTVYLKF
ncbi:MAG: hypothetical protein V3V49_14230 [Candidatus Krumholzibacteria bacterium]